MPADFNNENNLPNSQFDGSFINAKKLKAGQIGNNTTYNYNTYHRTEKPINPIKRIPHQGTANFVGRDKELALIHEILYTKHSTIAISAVEGIGGVGKTELAVKYAQTHQDDYKGRYDDAEPLFIQALELYKRILGDNHPDFASSLFWLAVIYKSQQKYNEAQSLLVQALEIYEQRLGSNHPNTKNCRDWLENLRSEMNSNNSA